MALSPFIAVVLFLVYVRYLENTTIFVPSKIVAATPVHDGLPFEDLTIKTEDGVLLNAWFIPRSNSQQNKISVESNATLFILHGNAGNLGDRLYKIRFFHDFGFNVFIVDYRGYGHSQGKPSEDGLYLDALAAFDYLLTRKDIDPKRVVLYGESLGGAVAVDLATKRAVAALIVDSCFSSAKEMAKRIYPFIPSSLVKLKFDSVSKVKSLNVPKLFIHSSEDEIVPYAIGRKLYEAAAQPKTFLEITGHHNDSIAANTWYFQEAIQGILKEIDLY